MLDDYVVGQLHAKKVPLQTLLNPPPQVTGRRVLQKTCEALRSKIFALQPLHKDPRVRIYANISTCAMVCTGTSSSDNGCMIHTQICPKWFC